MDKDFWREIESILSGDEYDSKSLGELTMMFAQEAARMGMGDFAEHIADIGNELRFGDLDRVEAHQQIQNAMLENKEEIRQAIELDSNPNMPQSQIDSFSDALKKLDQAFGLAPKVKTAAENPKATDSWNQVKNVDLEGAGKRQSFSDRISNRFSTAVDKVKARLSQSKISKENQNPNHTSRSRFSLNFDAAQENAKPRDSVKEERALPRDSTPSVRK